MLGRGREFDVATSPHGPVAGQGAMFDPGPARGARLFPPNKRSFNRLADVNIENYLPVFVTRQGPRQIAQTSLKSRIRSRYALIPGLGQ